MSKWPVKVKHRNRILAKIYRPCQGRNSYRVAWSVGRRRMMKSFSHYGGLGGARQFADALVKELAKGSRATALTPAQADDALAALDVLKGFYADTGKRVTLRIGIAEFVEAVRLLRGRSLATAVEGYLSTVASVKRKDIKEAVGEFIAGEDNRTKAAEGQRAQLSAKYCYNRAIMLRRFADAFENTSVCDLVKEHLDTFMGDKPVKEFSAKSRNHHRAAIRQFLQWSVRKDYLSATHRLNEADGMRPEHANTAETQVYLPAEFATLLEKADEALRPLLALGGLAGLRVAEMLRLDWADVWRVPGHIEITSSKSKTRQRRLVEVVPALEQWLAPYRAMTKGPLWLGHEVTFQQHVRELCEAAGIARKANGLRHSFCSYHFAKHGNEHLTAQQAGNSPQMVHSAYKGLATKSEAERWFAILPPQEAENVIAMMATNTA